MDIKAIIQEEVKTLFENLEIYTIPELAQMLQRLPDVNTQTTEIIADLMQKEYRRGGDQAVIDMYQTYSGVEIEALRNGRYVFSTLGGGGNPMLEIEDNCLHTPDEMPS